MFCCSSHLAENVVAPAAAAAAAAAAADNETQVTWKVEVNFEFFSRFLCEEMIPIITIHAIVQNVLFF